MQAPPVSVPVFSFGDHRLQFEVHRNHLALAGLRLFDRCDCRVVALLAVGQADGGGDLGAGEVLEELEVLLGFGRVAGALQRARHCELRRSVQRLDGERLLENFDLLVELLQLAVADALEVVGICIARIEFDGLLKAGERGVDLVVCVLRKAEVVPGLRIVRVERECRFEGLLGLVEFLQRHERDAFVDGGLRHLWILLERVGKAGGGAVSELLAHKGDTLVVQLNGLRVDVGFRCRESSRKRPAGSAERACRFA